MIRLFHVSIPPGSFLLLVTEALLVVGAFVLATYLAATVDPTDYLLYNFGLVSIASVVLTFILGLHFHDLYTQIHVKSRVLLLQQLAMVTGIAFLVQGMLSYLSVELRIPVRIMLAGSAIAIPVVFLWRLMFSTYAIPMLARTELLMVGSSPVLLAVGEYIDEHPEMGLHVQQYLSEQQVGTLIDAVREIRPSRVVLGLAGRPDAELGNQLMETRYGGIDIESAAITYERICGRVRLDSLQPEQVVYSGAFLFQPPRISYQVFFRGLMVGIVAVLALPLGLLTALALRVSTTGPILRCQILAGMSGEKFKAYEFCASDGSWTSRMVQRLGLSSLPRLLNVFRGEMAIVGPEPDKHYYVDALASYIPFYRERQAVRPGITGWAQIHLEGPIQDTLAKLEYDFYYIKNMSLGLDTMILLHTFKSLFEPAGEE